MAPAEDQDSPNALLLSFVKEWYDTAKERNSKGVTTYRKAYAALRACPMAFDHPSQLQQLKGFGAGLCGRLTVQLQKYCKENNIEMPEHPTASKKRKGAGGARTAGTDGLDDDDDNDDDGLSAPPTKKPRKTKPYVPTYGSGAYALVVALSKERVDAPVGLSKQDLIEAAQPYSKSSFTAPSDPNSFYTAWNSMKTLVAKELVCERGRPTKRYALTDEGWEVAKRIDMATNGGGTRPKAKADDQDDPAIPNASRASELRHPAFSSRLGAIIDDDGDGDGEDDNIPIDRPDHIDVVADGPVLSNNSSLPTFTPIILQPGTFDVHLVLDIREVRARTDRDYMKEQLVVQGVRPIMRAMDLGDIQWVAKCRDPDFLQRYGAQGDEVVLDYIVERKRLDDLIGSIKDGRFHEQKFRLRRSGVKHVTYLVEEISLDYTKYDEAVQTAIASTQVVDGFAVKQTRGMDESIRYLARMTKMLKKKYESKPLRVIPTEVITARNYLPLLKHLRGKEPGSNYYISYPAFSSLASKSGTLTLRDLYLKMLMCIRGVTGQKAIEIQKIWRTPNDLVRAFEQCGVDEQGKKRKRELVTCHLGNKVKGKQIGKALSVKIAEVWGGA
ncbi:unnamed protein product [Discula destructiva]